MAHFVRDIRDKALLVLRIWLRADRRAEVGELKVELRLRSIPLVRRNSKRELIFGFFQALQIVLIGFH